MPFAKSNGILPFIEWVNEEIVKYFYKILKIITTNR
jgi:tetrahydromethanopterin S-methyltransferase subunit A